MNSPGITAVSPSMARAQHSRSVLPFLAAGIIAALLLWFGRAGLTVYLTGDDLMNIYKAWREPYYQILLENVFYFTPGYRPMGSLVYRVIFDIAGLHAAPFRLISYALLGGNLYLLYRVAAAIGTREIGLLAALLGAYNAGFQDLYYNNGTIYDLLCFVFYFLALRLYVDIRRQGRLLDRRSLTTFLALYICALNSKETAVTLPVALLAYELTMAREAFALWARWFPAVLSGLLTVPYVIGKFSGSSPLIGNDAYRVHLGLRTYLRAMRHYLEVFILPPDKLTLTAAVLGLVGMGIVAILWRRRALVFAWLFILITPLPVAFIGLRGGYAIYITTFGMALYLATLIVEVRTALARLMTGRLNLQARHVLQFDTFAICLVILVLFHNSRPLGNLNQQDRLIRSLAEQISGAQPKSEPKRILFLEDPFNVDDWAQVFFLKLHYRSADLEVDRAKRFPQEPDQIELDSHDCIFTYEGARLARTKP